MALPALTGVSFGGTARQRIHLRQRYRDPRHASRAARGHSPSERHGRARADDARESRRHQPAGPRCRRDHAATPARRRGQPHLRRAAPGAVSHGCRQQPASSAIAITGTWVADSFTVGGGGGNIRMALSPDGTELVKTGGSVACAVRPGDLRARWAPPMRHRCSARASAPTSSPSATTGARSSVRSSPSAGATLFRYDMLNQNLQRLEHAA